MERGYRRAGVEGAAGVGGVLFHSLGGVETMGILIFLSLLSAAAPLTVLSWGCGWGAISTGCCTPMELLDPRDDLEQKISFRNDAHAYTVHVLI